MRNMKFEKNYFSPLTSHFSPRKGFTLIELLVTFTLISIITGIGLASFVSYSQRQVVVQAASDFKQAVDLARFNALSSVKPKACSGVLSDFKFNVCFNATCYNSGVDYEVIVGCGLDLSVLSKKLPQNVTFSNVVGSPNCTTLKFTPISGVVTGVPCEIFVNGYGNQIKVSIDLNGHASY